VFGFNPATYCSVWAKLHQLLWEEDSSPEPQSHSTGQACLSKNEINRS